MFVDFLNHWMWVTHKNPLWDFLYKPLGGAWESSCVLIQIPAFVSHIYISSKDGSDRSLWKHWFLFLFFSFKGSGVLTNQNQTTTNPRVLRERTVRWWTATLRAGTTCPVNLSILESVRKAPRRWYKPTNHRSAAAYWSFIEIPHNTVIILQLHL